MDTEEVSKRCVLFKNVPSDTTEHQFRHWLDDAQNPAYRNVYTQVHQHIEDEQDTQWIVLFKQEKDALDCIKTSQLEVTRQSGGTLKLIPDYCSECIVPNEWMKKEDWVRVDKPGEQPFSLVPDDYKQSSHSSMSSITSEDLFADRKASTRVDKGTNKTREVRGEHLPDEEGRISSNELFGSGRNSSESRASSTTSSAMFGSGRDGPKSLGFQESLDGGVDIVKDVKETNEEVDEQEAKNTSTLSSNKLDTNTDAFVKLDKNTKEIPAPANVTMGEKSDSKSMNGEDDGKPPMLRQGDVQKETDQSEKGPNSQQNATNVHQGISNQYEGVLHYQQLAPGGGPMPFVQYPLMQQPAIQMPTGKPQGCQGEMHYVFVPIPVQGGVPLQAAVPSQGGVASPMLLPMNIYGGPYMQQNYMPPTQGQQMYANNNPSKSNEEKTSKAPDGNVYSSAYDTYITPTTTKAEASNKSTNRVDRLVSEMKRNDTIDVDESGPREDTARAKDKTDGVPSITFENPGYEMEPIYSSIKEDDLVGDRTLTEIKRRTRSPSDQSSHPPTVPSRKSQPKKRPESTSRLVIIDDSTEEETTLQKMIRIEGLPPNASEDLIQLFVERKEVSGGAEVKEIQVNPEKQEAIVRMRYGSDVEEILKKQEHRKEPFKLLKRPLQISVYTPPPRDPTKVFISGLKEGTSNDNLQNFIEVCCGNVPVGIEYGQTPGTALLTFDKPPEFETFKEKVKQRSLEDHHLEISEVEVTQSVKVKGYDPELSHDALLYYFENTKRSGGGEVERVEYQQENNVHIVHFLKAEDAVSVSDRGKHEVSGTEITVCLYYPCLDLSSEYKVNIPDPLELTYLDPSIVRFLKDSSPFRMKFEVQMKKKCFASVEWPSNEEEPLKLLCDLDPMDRGTLDKVKSWEFCCKQEIDNLCSELAVSEEIYVAQEVWKGVRERVNEIAITEPDMVMIRIKREDYLIIVFGLRHQVDELSQVITRIVSELEQKFAAGQQTITKSKTLMTYQAALLRYIKFAEKSTSSSLTVAMADRQIEFKGSKMAVDEGIQKMQQRLKEFARRPVEGYTKAAKDLLFQKETRNYIKAKVNKRRLLLVWDVIRGRDLVLYSKTEKDLDEAVDIFMKSLMQTTIPLDASMKIMTQNKDWESHLLQLSNNDEYAGLIHIEVKLEEIYLVGVDAVFQKVYDDILKFFDLHGDISEFFHVEKGQFLYIIANKKRELEGIEKQYTSLSVKIDRVDKDRKGFKIRGKKDGCRLAISKLQEMVDNITYKDLTIAKPGFEEFLQRNEGRDELHNIEISERCILIPEMSGSDESPVSTVNEIPKEAAACKIGGLSISVMEGDITCLLADMIVNPSSPNLSHGIGLGSAIVDKGGFEIQKECNEHVRKKHSNLADADIFVSNGGKLPVKSIIHVVLPTWRDGSNNERSVLRHAVENCLKECKERRCRTLGLPVIGSGTFLYPVDVAAKNILEMIKRHSTDKGSIERIFLCDKKSEKVKAFINALKEKAGSSEVQVYKEDSSDGSGSSTSSGGDVADLGEQGPVVTVVEGELAKQAVDVIVNSTNQNMDLKVGFVSRGILQAGGESIQMECNARYAAGIRVGDVAITTGGDLKCRKVFHGILMKWDQGHGPAENVMGTFIQRCLEEAEKHKFTSIAFPALGTGNLGFPADIVAKLMFDCAGSLRSIYLKEVKLVVWTGDSSTVSTFHDAAKQFKKEQQIGRHRSVSDIYKPSGYLVRNANKGFKTSIKNVTMEILQGDITKQKTGAIVNSVLKDLNLKNGRVSAAILEAGGGTIQTECLTPVNKQRMEREGLIVTNPGKLLCQKIIHMKAKSSSQGWEKMVIRCLGEVEQLGLNSVTFPALGTGGRGCPPDSMAKLMMSAFRQYIDSREFQQCLKSIKIVIYETHMLEIFSKSLSERASSVHRVSKVLDIFRSKQVPVSNVKIHVYIDSQSHLENVERKITDLFLERNIYLLREKLSEKESKDIIRKGESRHVDVTLKLKDGIIQLQGYGNSVREVKMDIEHYLNRLKFINKQDEVLASVSLPKRWSKMNLRDPMKLELLTNISEDYKRIYKRFSVEVGRQVVKIERIQNPALYIQYSMSKCQMEQTNKRSQFPFERCLWHGTSGNAVDSINSTGFNRNFNSGASHGVGVYFAVSGKTSLSYCRPDVSGHYHMYYCHVLTGDCCVGSQGIKNPPPKSSTQPSVTYDSTTDSVQSPNFFVIFHDARAYPSYHIEFV